MHSEKWIPISFQIKWNMIVVIVFVSILNQMEFYLVQNRTTKGKLTVITIIFHSISEVIQIYFSDCMDFETVVTLIIGQWYNHTKLISALILTPLSNNIKRWLPAYLKENTATLLAPHPFTLEQGVTQGSCISLTLFNFFVFTYPQSDTLFFNSYADDFTDSCSITNVAQKAEVLTIHATNIGTWADEPFILQNPPSLSSTLNSHNLILILASL